MSTLRMRKLNEASTGGRLLALDGLRGVAAVVVLLHHTFLLVPVWPGNVARADVAPGSSVWLLNFTPLKLATAGWESVMVFFVLSGLVVSLPVLRTGFDWVAYYPRRLTRILVPVAGSALLAGIWVAAIVQRTPQATGTWLSSSSTPSFSWEYVIRAIDLFGGDGHINNPLWSLRWELLFSLLLPVFVIMAVALRRWWPGAVIASIALTWLGLHSGSGALSYLPAFFIGAILAVQREKLEEFIANVNSRAWSAVIWLALLVAGSALLIASWLVGPLPSQWADAVTALRALAPLGAAVLIVVGLGWHPLERLLSSSLLQWTGRISFSLYLVHVPILIFSFYLLGSQPLIARQILGICLSLIIAVAFWRVLESRSHGWSRRIGTWSSHQYSRVTARV